MGLPFFAADTLGMTLFQIDGDLEATEIRKLPFGPWRIDMLMQAHSDLITGREISFWFKIAALRMYVIIRETEAWVMVLDVAALVADYPGQTIAARMLELKPAIRGMFHFERDAWTQIPEQNWP